MKHVHLGLALFTVFAAWKWGDWRNWRKYQATMLYITSGGLLYEYLVRENSLWKFHPDLLFGHRMTVVVYAMLTMPLSVLIYLSRLPKASFRRQAFYIAKWIFIYGSAELALLWAGRISYQNQWSFWYSIIFDAVMFSMLLLHHKKTLLCYGISIIIIVFLMILFKIPMEG